MKVRQVRGTRRGNRGGNLGGGESSLDIDEAKEEMVVKVAQSMAHTRLLNLIVVGTGVEGVGRTAGAQLSLGQDRTVVFYLMCL